jgi:hypothetical protein
MSLRDVGTEPSHPSRILQALIWALIINGTLLLLYGFLGTETVTTSTESIRSFMARYYAEICREDRYICEAHFYFWTASLDSFSLENLAYFLAAGFVFIVLGVAAVGNTFVNAYTILGIVAFGIGIFLESYKVKVDRGAASPGRRQ